MKIKKEHYEVMKNEIKKVPCNINDHREWLKVNAKYNDLEKRLRWDFARAARMDMFLLTNVYPYANDEHIDTALKNIIKEIEKEA